MGIKPMDRACKGVAVPEIGDSSPYYSNIVIVAQATILLATLLPHRNLLNVPDPPFTTSLPHDVPSPRIVEPFTPTPARPSWRPTSHPITYPAPNPTTLTSTSTPALTTQVRSVGDKDAEVSAFSAKRTFFFFVDAFSPQLGLDADDDDAFRLFLSRAMASCDEMDGLERARVLGVRGRDELAAGMISDSGTRRSETGSFPLGGLACWRLGRPRAAAAPMESSVVREARSAAS
jgi:hypothetical protein